jgi:putative aldouronate transport system permease protein
MVAYTLTRKDFVLGKFVTLLYVLTMYVNAGLIPGYMVNKTFGLVNNFLVYIIPGLVSAFNLIVVRTYMKTIPDSLHESAEIDGAGEFTIFLKIILPLSMPVLATVTLFSAVGQWNQWFDTMIYCSGSPKLHTLQYKLMAALQSSMNQSGTSTANVVNTEAASNQVTPVSIRAATTIVAAVPILIVYPFLQKYFVTGMTVGSVKE